MSLGSVVSNSSSFAHWGVIVIQAICLYRKRISASMALDVWRLPTGSVDGQCNPRVGADTTWSRSPSHSGHRRQRHSESLRNGSEHRLLDERVGFPQSEFGR